MNSATSLQIQLANTAHQREVADLQAAGLNPVLSAKYGGAAVPSIATGVSDVSGSASSVGSYHVVPGSEPDNVVSQVLNFLDPKSTIRIFGIPISVGKVQQFAAEHNDDINAVTQYVSNALGVSVNPEIFTKAVERAKIEQRIAASENPDDPDPALAHENPGSMYSSGKNIMIEGLAPNGQDIHQKSFLRKLVAFGQSAARLLKGAKAKEPDPFQYAPSYYGK